MLEKLTHTKKFQRMLDRKDLYAVPVSAVPGCGFLLGMLLKREGICRASDLYELFKKHNRKAFTEYLQLTCKLGKWSGIYVNVAIRALEDWQKINDPKPEKKVKVKEEAPKKEKIPHKVGEGSKKWAAFMAREDLAKTRVQLVPGIAGILGCELNKQGYKTAQQLMDQWQGDKKGQCKGDEAAFHKWVLCTFGYWNTQYTRVVLSALKAYGQSKGMTFMEKVVNAAENAADQVSEAIAKEETNANEDDVAKEETNANEDQESFFQEQDPLDQQDSNAASENDGSEDAKNDSEADRADDVQDNADDAQDDANANANFDDETNANEDQESAFQEQDPLDQQDSNAASENDGSEDAQNDSEADRADDVQDNADDAQDDANANQD